MTDEKWGKRSNWNFKEIYEKKVSYSIMVVAMTVERINLMWPAYTHNAAADPENFLRGVEE